MSCSIFCTSQGFDPGVKYGAFDTALRLDVAMPSLTIMANGIYGGDIRHQTGAPAPGYAMDLWFQIQQVDRSYHPDR